MTHGTPTAYNRYKCRCDDCRKAWAVYDKAGRLSRQARGICVDCGQKAASPHTRCDLHLLKMRARYHERKAQVTA